MKKLIIILGVIFGFSAVSHADFVKYTKEAFEGAQKNNEKIILHFSADWCPTCRAQKESMKALEKDGTLSGLILIEADFDKDKELKKLLKVSHQSTFVTFYGANETGRATSQTSVEDLKKFFTEKLVSLTLKDQLKFMNEVSANRLPPEKRKIMEDATEKLRASQLAAKALQVGQTFPSFKLKNAEGKTIELKTLLKKGPLVVTFYRGAWCPYCNAQLVSYEKYLDEFKKRDTTLIAITPEKPELGVTLKAGKKLTFDILHDQDNKLAGKLRLVFEITPELKSIYQQFGIDLAKSQENQEWKLPIPATYVVSKTGKIVYAFLDVDYTKRADPSDLLKALDEIKK